jgi:hypothetical protein
VDQQDVNIVILDVNSVEQSHRLECIAQLTDRHDRLIPALGGVHFLLILEEELI